MTTMNTRKRKIVLYTACSLDGMIAGPNDELDWLYEEGDYGYEEFYDSIDTTLMGNGTYKVIQTLGEFPYHGKHNFVFTNAIMVPNENEPVSYVKGDVIPFVESLLELDGSNIWLVGGGEINTMLLDAGLIDDMILSIHPIVLGKGKPLFAGDATTTDFRTKSAKKYKSGLVQIHLVKPED